VVAGVWLCAEGRQEFINHLQMVIELHNLADLHFQRGSRAFSAALYWYLLLAEAVGEEVEGIDKVQEEDEVEDEDEDEEDGEDSDEMEQGTKKLRNEQKLETCPKCDTPLIENEIALMHMRAATQWRARWSSATPLIRCAAPFARRSACTCHARCLALHCHARCLALH